MNIGTQNLRHQNYHQRNNFNDQHLDIRDCLYIANNFSDSDMVADMHWVNGAWYAFQEQQKQIDNIKYIVESIIPYDMDMDTIRKIGDIKELLK